MHDFLRILTKFYVAKRDQIEPLRTKIKATAWPAEQRAKKLHYFKEPGSTTPSPL